MKLSFIAIFVMAIVVGCGDDPDLGLIDNLDVSFYRWNGDGKEITEVAIGPGDPFDIAAIVNNDDGPTRVKFLFALGTLLWQEKPGDWEQVVSGTRWIVPNGQSLYRWEITDNFPVPGEGVEIFLTLVGRDSERKFPIKVIRQ